MSRPKASPWKRLEKSVKQALVHPLALLRYGSARPSRAKLRGCDNWIHIDPDDPCAIKKVVHEPLRGKTSPNLVFWRDFNAHLEPGLVIDVGVNYGECLFGTNYARHSRIHGFEANPRLHPFLEKSRAGHPDGGRITLHHCLVSDSDAEEVPFYVNPDWSGSSSALREVNPRDDNLVVKLPARRIDGLIPADHATGATVLLKMDIEGFESPALRGLTAVLEAAAGLVGLIEFDIDYIRWAGQDPADYLGWLRERFDTFRLVDAKRRLLRPVATLDDVPFLHGTRRKHTDLALVLRGTRDDWLAPGWSC
jgi:FkbM family methyltransferase